VKSESRTAVHLLAGPALFAAALAAMPGSRAAAAAIGLTLWMLYWWITRPVHIAVTALLPIAVNSLAGIAPMDTVLASYFSPIAVLLLGASLLLAVWSACGLDQRIAVRALLLIGPSVRGQLLVWYWLATLASMFLPNSVVAAVLCPIAAAMLRACRADIPETGSPTRYFILLAIVWGAGIGGFGTPLGGSMNLVAIRYIEDFTGAEYSYVTWTLRMAPYLLLLSAGISVYLLLVRLDVGLLPGSRAHFRTLYAGLGAMGRDQKIALALFLLAVVASFARPLYERLLPGLQPYYAFLLAGMAAMLLRSEKGGRLITWEQAARSVNWGLLLLFSGGMAAGNLILSSGAAEAVARLIGSLSLSAAAVLPVFVMAGILLSNASSNTAATAVLLPVVISVMSLMGHDPLPMLYPAAAACNCAFVLPTSIRAIPVGYGLDIGFMFRKGWAALLVCLVLLVVAGLAAVL
jgi:sodium-dependent dicarboxylate transporter 2/3/5